MKAYSYNATGSDGLTYPVRPMLEDVELDALQRVGILGEVFEVAGVHTAAESLVAGLQKDFYLSCGGVIQ